MAEIAWQAEHSVEASAPLEFAWAFMSNIANWNDPPARFVLVGPFTNGSQGTTHMPGQPPQRWQLLDVIPEESYAIEFPLDRAVMRFKWSFAALADKRTRLAQSIVLEGENSATYLPFVQQTFAVSLRPGMDRIVASIDAAYIARK